jgi:hypothetical protein
LKRKIDFKFNQHNIKLKINYGQTAPVPSGSCVIDGASIKGAEIVGKSMFLKG